MRETNRLYEDLLRDYNRLVRPSYKPSDAVYIEFKFKLLQILDVVSTLQITLCSKSLARKRSSFENKRVIASRLDRLPTSMEARKLWKC
jgi:hypothetical protein